MKRKAIIIASPLTRRHPHFLPGVPKDAINYLSFLTSPLGGGWRRNEIEVLLNPTVKNVNDIMFQTKADYVFTVFSGHGGTDNSTRKAVLQINDKESILLGQLTAKSTRQLAIIDTCSTFINYSISEEQSLIGDPFGYTPTLTMYEARLRFDRRVMASTPGWTVVHSASLGQASIDTPEGGVFTYSLLKMTRLWGSQTGVGNILPLKVAYSQSNQYIKKRFRVEQTPRILHSGKEPNFPFALR